MKKHILFILISIGLVLLLSCNIDSSRGVYRSVITAQEYSDSTVRPFLCRLVDRKNGLDPQGYYYYNYFFVSDDGLDVFNEKTKKIYHIISNEDLSKIFSDDGLFVGIYNSQVRRAAVNKVVYGSDKMTELNVLCLTGKGDLFSAAIRWDEDIQEYQYELLHDSLEEDEKASEKGVGHGALPYTGSVKVRDLTPGGFFIHSNDAYYWANPGKSIEEAKNQDTVTSESDISANDLTYIAEDPIGEKTGLVLVGESGGSFAVCEGTRSEKGASLNKLFTSHDGSIAFNDGLMGFKYMGSLKTEGDETYDNEKTDPSNYAVVRMVYESSTYIYNLYEMNSKTSLRTLSEKPGRYYMQLPIIRYEYGDPNVPTEDYYGDTIISIKGSSGFTDYDWDKHIAFGKVSSDYKKELNDTDMVNIRPAMFLEDEEQELSFKEMGNKYTVAEYVVATDDNFLYVLMPYDVRVKSGKITCSKYKVPQTLTLTEYNESDL